MQLVNRFQELWLVIIFVCLLVISLLMIYIGQNSFVPFHYSFINNETFLHGSNADQTTQIYLSLAPFSDQDACGRLRKASHYIINPRQLCSSALHKLKLLVLVCVAVNDQDRRNAIRETWGADARTADSNYRVAFVMGNSLSQADNLLIKNEADKFRDIIQDVSYLDSYENLTLKSLSALYWFKQHCGDADFLIKADADIFLNVPELLRQIVDLTESSFIMGSLQQRAAVERSEGSKWRVSPSVWPDSIYPDYVSGSCYLMSSKAVSDMFRFCSNVEKLFIWEDIFVTGILAQASKVRRIHNNGFSYTLRNLRQLCDYKRSITSHRVTADQLRHIWKKLPLTSC